MDLTRVPPPCCFGAGPEGSEYARVFWKQSIVKDITGRLSHWGLPAQLRLLRFPIDYDWTEVLREVIQEMKEIGYEVNCTTQSFLFAQDEIVAICGIQIEAVVTIGTPSIPPPPTPDHDYFKAMALYKACVSKLQ